MDGGGRHALYFIVYTWFCKQYVCGIEMYKL